ncbi:MAG: hypothetical protein AAF663_04685, partial [Planctomycetota bacterium]
MDQSYRPTKPATPKPQPYAPPSPHHLPIGHASPLSRVFARKLHRHTPHTLVPAKTFNDPTRLTSFASRHIAHAARRDCRSASLA